MARSRVDAVKLVGLVERLLTKRAPVNAGLGTSGELSWYCEIERKVSPDFLSLFPIWWEGNCCSRRSRKVPFNRYASKALRP